MVHVTLSDVVAYPTTEAINRVPAHRLQILKIIGPKYSNNEICEKNVVLPVRLPFLTVLYL
jgi:hypothetical protein